MDLIQILKNCDQIQHFLQDHLVEIPEWQFFEILTETAEFFCILHTSLSVKAATFQTQSPDSAIRVKINEELILDSEDPLIVALVSYLMQPTTQHARPTSAVIEFIQMKVNALKAHHWIRWTPHQVLIYALDNPLFPSLTIYQFHDENTTIYIFQHIRLTLVYTWSINPSLTESIAQQEAYTSRLKDQLQIAEAQLRNQTQLQEKLKVTDEKGHKLKDRIHQLESEKADLELQFKTAQMDWEKKRNKIDQFQKELQIQFEQMYNSLLSQNDTLNHFQTSLNELQNRYDEYSDFYSRITKTFSQIMEKVKNLKEL